MQLRFGCVPVGLTQPVSVISATALNAFSIATQGVAITV